MRGKRANPVEPARSRRYEGVRFTNVVRFVAAGLPRRCSGVRPLLHEERRNAAQRTAEA